MVIFVLVENRYEGRKDGRKVFRTYYGFAIGKNRETALKRALFSMNSDDAMAIGNKGAHVIREEGEF